MAQEHFQSAPAWRPWRGVSAFEKRGAARVPWQSGSGGEACCGVARAHLGNDNGMASDSIETGGGENGRRQWYWWRQTAGATINEVKAVFSDNFEHAATG